MTNNAEERRIREMLGNFIPSITKADDIATLFSLLGYPAENIHAKPLQRKKESFDFRKEDDEKISNIYSPISFGEDIPVFLLETTSLAPSFIRSTTNTLDHQYLRFMAIFTTDYSEIVFVYPKKVRDEKGTRKLKITKLILKKEDLHYTEIQTLARLFYPQNANWRAVWRQWGEAFNVEAVTKQFFEDYKRIFFRLRESILNQGFYPKESHEFALQFLNRVMFIYFIAKKGWLKQTRFVRWLWASYTSGNKFGTDTFYRDWLSQVFFKAFNNKSSDITGLPDDVNRVLLTAPYLNGGLFKEKDTDRLDATVSDEMFKAVLTFFEKYNFTIREDQPLDEEVAVDPQMIGYVYESLANVAEEIYDRNDLGIFYTPRVEVDFMCRRALVGSLINQMPDVSRESLYHFVFDPPENKEKTSHINGNPEIWFKIERILNDLSVVDPACGSGAFLVGMLSVLTELHQTVYAHTAGNKKSVFNIKYSIIQRSLYGVDVMPWAVRAAELRLWLHLIVDTDVSIEDIRKGPLLPNLNLKLRVGDSMVQEMGGISFNIRSRGLDEGVRRDLERLKQEKDKFFESSRTARYLEAKEFCRVETTIFLRIIDATVKRIEKEIRKSEERLASSTKQTDLFGETVKKELQASLKEKKSQKEIESEIGRLKDEIHRLKSVKSVLDDPEKKPFIWDIDFAEIFGEKNGFDIVIGNPPYVRQEMISPPNRIKAEVTLEDRREYKEKLISSVQTQFPVIQKIDKKSDLYIYFYFHGLSLLNEKGVFCFITSNSWLDVGYGKDLQEFLLKYVPIHAIYDNPKRSFVHADVNTIIAVFGAPALREESFEEKIRTGVNAPWTKLSNSAKFVMFKKPFEEGISAETLIAIDRAQARVKGGELIDLVENIVQMNECRIFPVMQEDLLEDGWEYPEGYDHDKGRFRKGKYTGNKWGGKYLRAPDIFYSILKKGKGKLVRLGDIAEVRFGIKTGANEFFYLDKEAQKKWEVEEEFLKPVIKSPKESKSPIIDTNKLKYKIFMCHKSKKELVGTKALEYILYGERIGIHKRPSVSSRKRWYDLGNWVEPKIIIPCGIGDTYRVYLNQGKIFADKRLYFANPTDEVGVVLVANSTLYMLTQELISRVGLGDGLLDLTVDEVASSIIIDPKYLNEYKELSKILYRDIHSVFVECGIDITKPIDEQTPSPLADRWKLDKRIFAKIGLDDSEIKDVYRSLCQLVKNRLDKAKSLS